MLEKTQFVPEFKTGQTIMLKSKDGTFLDSCDANIGYLQGDNRKIKAIVCDGIEEGENWTVFDVIGSHGMAFDHIAVKGAVSQNQAERFCEKYFQIDNEHNPLKKPVTISDSGLKIFLDSLQTPHKTSFLLQADAMILDAMVTKEEVIWDEDNNLSSHHGHMAHVMLDMVRCDVNHELLEKVFPKDVIAMLIDGQCSFGMFDAMILKYRQLELAVQKIADALKQAGHDEFFVKSVTPIEPFKRMGVVNVGAIFEMSDTQTITVLFNNPDTTPAKLLPNDVITSWKWILNKRDVTAVLQPRAVDAKKYPLIASRMFKLLAKNHARFQRAQAARTKDEALLSELISQLEAAQLEDKTLDEKYQNILKEMDDIGIRKQQNSDAIAIKPENEETETINSISLNVGDFVSAKFANLNKNSSIREYQDEVEKGDYSDADCIVQKVLNLSPEKYDEFVNSFLTDNELIKGFGGTVLNNDPTNPEYLRIVVVVSALGKETIVVDPRGSSYARYVGLDVKKITPPEEFANIYVDENSEVHKKEIEDTPSEQNDIPKIEGDEFGEFDLPEDQKELRVAANEALKEMIGKSFPCPTLNTDVYIRKSGVKKIISSSGDTRKLQAIAVLKELLQNATKIESLKTYTEKTEQNIIAYHILSSPLELKDERINVRFVIREDDKGHYHYDHSINSDFIQNAKSPLLDGLFTAVLPKSGVSQDDLAKLIRNADCKLGISIENNQNEVNIMVDDLGNETFVLNMFISSDEIKVEQEDLHKFLNDVIAGTIDLGADETGERLEKIGENLAPEDEALFEQAANVYADFAINNANSLNG